MNTEKKSNVIRQYGNTHFFGLARPCTGPAHCHSGKIMVPRPAYV